jgi:hypothetical protein
MLLFESIKLLKYSRDSLCTLSCAHAFARNPTLLAHSPLPYTARLWDRMQRAKTGEYLRRDTLIDDRFAGSRMYNSLRPLSKATCWLALQLPHCAIPLQFPIHSSLGFPAVHPSSIIQLIRICHAQFPNENIKRKTHGRSS